MVSAPSKPYSTANLLVAITPNFSGAAISRAQSRRARSQPLWKLFAQHRRQADNSSAIAPLCVISSRVSARSGRTVARTGLRMMPTFLSSSQDSVRRVFPQYGSKAGLSDRAFPDRAAVKLAPSMPVARSSLPPSMTDLSQHVVPYVSGEPLAACIQFLRNAHLPSPENPSARHSRCYPCRGLLIYHCYDLLRSSRFGTDASFRQPRR